MGGGGGRAEGERCRCRDGHQAGAGGWTRAPFFLLESMWIDRLPTTMIVSGNSQTSSHVCSDCDFEYSLSSSASPASITRASAPFQRPSAPRAPCEQMGAILLGREQGGATHEQRNGSNGLQLVRATRRGLPAATALDGSAERERAHSRLCEAWTAAPRIRRGRCSPPCSRPVAALNARADETASRVLSVPAPARLGPDGA